MTKRAHPGGLVPPSALSLALALCLTLALGPSLAHGNNSRSDGTSDNSSRGSSTNSDEFETILIATTVVSLAGTTFGAYRSTKGSEHQADMAELYLRHHAVQVRQDLCLGRGPLLRDLAKALKLNKKQDLQFRKAIAGKRRALLALAHPKRLTKERALRFFWEIGLLVPRKVLPKRA